MCNHNTQTTEHIAGDPISLDTDSTDATDADEAIDEDEYLNEELDNEALDNESLDNESLDIEAEIEDGIDNGIGETLHEYLKYFGHLDKAFVESQDIILVSDTFYNLTSLYFVRDNYTVNRIIIDECNSIKVSRLLEINCIFTWLVTSSISSLMTSNGFIYKRAPNGNGQVVSIREKTILSTGFIMNTIFNLYENISENFKLFLINKPEYIQQSILLPELITIILICKDNVNIRILSGLVSHDIMNMLNAGDIEGIITRLDVVVDDENNIIKMITQKFLDELKIKEYELKVAIENPNYKPQSESFSVINKRIAVQDLKAKITCIEDRIKAVDNCPICLDDFTNPTITPCCNNKFCFNCITLTLNSKSNCPTCRAELTISSLLVLSDKNKDDDDVNVDADGNAISDTKSIVFNDTSISTNSLYKENFITNTEMFKTKSLEFTKYENMDKIFEMNRHQDIKKYLIFTEYESTLNTKITTILDKWGLKYGRIRGTSATISKQMEKYKTNDADSTNVLLVNSKFFGSGMNLENTTDIIIMHKMNSDVEMQAIGRAHRFGREGNLRVWKLYYQNEMTV